MFVGFLVAVPFDYIPVADFHRPDVGVPMVPAGEAGYVDVGFAELREDEAVLVKELYELARRFGAVAAALVDIDGLAVEESGGLALHYVRGQSDYRLDGRHAAVGSVQQRRFGQRNRVRVPAVGDGVGAGRIAADDILERAGPSGRMLVVICNELLEAGDFEPPAFDATVLA